MDAPWRVVDARTTIPVTLDIYSAAGRLVRRLIAPQTMALGHHSMAWDGRDDRGGDLASGIYLYSVRTEEGVQSGKMSLIR